MLSINSKAGGVNHKLPGGPSDWAAPLRARDPMVLGVDVTHSAAGSVAAVVGSMDRCVAPGGRWFERPKIAVALYLSKPAQS